MTALFPLVQASLGVHSQRSAFVRFEPCTVEDTTIDQDDFLDADAADAFSDNA